MQTKKSSLSIEHREALPSHSGNGELIAVDTGAQTRADNGKRPSGFKRGGEAAKKTIREKKKEKQLMLEKRADSLRHAVAQQNGLEVPDTKSLLEELESDPDWKQETPK